MGWRGCQVSFCAALITWPHLWGWVYAIFALQTNLAPCLGMGLFQFCFAKLAWLEVFWLIFWSRFGYQTCIGSTQAHQFEYASKSSFFLFGPWGLILFVSLCANATVLSTQIAIKQGSAEPKRTLKVWLRMKLLSLKFAILKPFWLSNLYREHTSTPILICFKM